MTILKLVKLIYLADRLSLERRGVPIVGGAYYSMKNGPVPTDVLDLINEGRLYGVEDNRWEEHISARAEHEVSLKKTPPYDELSASELRLLDEVHREHGQSNQWQLVQWCHENCAEWTPLKAGRKPIQLSDIGEALGMADRNIERLSSNARELSFVQEALSA